VNAGGDEPEGDGADRDEVEPLPKYDRLAEGYHRHWGPVIRPAAQVVLEHVDGTTAPRRIIDIGAGTGTLALAALRRWPLAAVTAIDSASAMLAIAEREAGALPGAAVDRLATLTALADRLPFADGTFDLAVSSFVLQLVPSRAAALREAHRVLVPGGRIAWVAWLDGGERFGADRVVDDVLGAFGFDPPDLDDAGGDIASVGSAAATTRAAGFRSVRAREGWMEHRWTAEGYLGMLTEFDEESLFAELDRAERRRIERRLLAALRRLPEGDLTMRLPVVYVTALAG